MCVCVCVYLGVKLSPRYETMTQSVRVPLPYMSSYIT